MKRFALVVLSVTFALAAPLSKRWWTSNHWVDIWTMAPLLDTSLGLPPPPYNQSETGVFNDTTIRQTFHMTLDADQIRLRVDNQFSATVLSVTSMTVALTAANATGATSGQPTIQTDSVQTITFNGNSSIQVPPNAIIVSDPVNLTVVVHQDISVSLYLANGQTGYNVTAHDASVTTSWFTTGGDQTSAYNFTDASTVAFNKWYYVSGVEAWKSSDSRAAIAIGDSITDHIGATLNGNDGWVDYLFDRMQADGSTRDIALVNKGISGNTILTDAVGIDAVGRIDTDAIIQAGVGYVLLFEGVNDIGRAANTTAAQDDVYSRLIQGYEQIITKLHTFGIPVFGSTITPFGAPSYAKTPNGYSNPTREQTRLRVNYWIINGGRLDYAFDFASAIANETVLSQMQDQYSSGDYLHPNPKAYKLMASVVDLSKFGQFANGVSNYL